jgi:hypothetical protein
MHHALAQLHQVGLQLPLLVAVLGVLPVVLQLLGPVVVLLVVHRHLRHRHHRQHHQHHH